jgi:hypothetical protein
MNQDIDATPFMKGLPDDRCQCPHWGYVFKGKMTARYADPEEVFEVGDAFYTPPGHVSVKTEPADPMRSKAVDSIVEHPDIISEGESRATDEASTETEESFAPPEEDRAEGEA